MVNRKGVWSAVIGLVLVLAVGSGGMAWYQAKQEREVLAPQRLVDHLKAVQAGDAELSENDVVIEQLRPVEVERIRLALRADLEATAHPDPTSAVSQLMDTATAHLESEEGTLAAIERWLRRQPSSQDWSIVKQTPEQWWVRAGEHCLSLMFDAQASDVVWRWQAVTECPTSS